MLFCDERVKGVKDMQVSTEYLRTLQSRIDRVGNNMANNLSSGF